MRRALAWLLLGAGAASATAGAGDWRASWDGTFYGYAKHNVLRGDSVLNPDNRVAGLARNSDSAELRLNVKAESDGLRLTARAIATTQETRNAAGAEQHGNAYLGQWQLRLRAAEGWHLAAGREVLNWGPAQFRSPSSPFYFDNGRRDPLRELVGMDALKVSWTPDTLTSISLVRLFGAGHGTPQADTWRDSWLAKLDQRGEAWALGLVALKTPDLTAFYGAHGQTTLSDALLLYGEASSAALLHALQSPTDTTQPFTLQSTGPRRTTTLLGASYTFASGQSLAAEYLHDGHGYTAAQENAYFQRALKQPGMALGWAPRLLGRDYLHLLWQSNLMDEGGYWRLMYTRNLSDHGSEFAAYGESLLAGKVSAYVLAVLPWGEARQEFSALLQRSVTLGLKIALP